MLTPIEVGAGVYEQITQHPETLDMTKWCGTACCIGGWALIIAGIPARREPEGDYYVYMKDAPPETHEWFSEVLGCTTYTTIHYVAQKLLGLSDAAAEKLFYHTGGMLAAQRLKEFVDF